MRKDEMSNPFDDLARALASPMPRRRVLRTLGGVVAVAAFPGLRARPAYAARGGLTCPPGTSVCSNGKGSELCKPDGGACCIFSYEIVVCPRGWRCGTEASPACVCDGAVDRTGACVQCAVKCKNGMCCPEFCCERTFSRKTYCCVFEEFVKDACKDAEVVSIIAGIAIGVAAGLAVVATGGLAAIALVGLAAGVGLGGVGAKICGDDPPDPLYKELFRPRVPRVASVRPGKGISAAAARALNRMIANRLRSGAYTVAWIRSIEKAQGADKAGDTTWARRHRTAAAGYARVAATALERDKSLSTVALRELQNGGFVDTGVTLAQVRQWQKRVQQRGLPLELARVLGAAGVGDARVTAYRNAVTQLEPKLVAGVGVFGNVTDPRLAAANVKMIGALRRSASTLSNA